MVSFLPIPGRSRNILLIGDEGITIYDVAGRSIKFIDQIDWVTTDFEDKLIHILQNDCRKKPIVLLYDMVEQHYRKEMIPSVGFMDKKNVISRKLAVTFPNYKMRSALALKKPSRKNANKDQSNVSSLKSAPYLFAAVPSSELLSSLIRSVLASGLPIQGFYLLPVEATGLVGKINKKIYGTQQSEWTLFMGQHSSGNLRQIVVKNDELALTRMTPFTQSQENVESWAADIVQEYKVTASYLSRLGYKPEDRINIIVVGPEEAQSSLEEIMQDNADLTVLSVAEAAKIAGAPTLFDQSEDYADILYAGWCGQASSFTLPVRIDAFEDVIFPRRIANFVVLALLAGGGWFGYELAINGTKAMGIQSELSSKEKQLSSLNATYSDLLDQKKELGFDIRKLKGAFSARDELNAFTLSPFKILKGSSEALGVLGVDEIIIRHADGEEVGLRNLDKMPGRQGELSYLRDQKDKDKSYDTYSRFSLTFASSVTTEEANRIVNEVMSRMRSQLPGYDIDTLKKVRDRGYEIDVEGQIGQAAGPDVKEDNTAVIEIRGPV